MNPPLNDHPEDDGPPFEITPVPPELLAYARQTLDIDAIEAEIREVLAGGGVPFEHVIAAVEAAMREES